MFDFAESFMKEHDLSPSSHDARPDDAMECSQPVDPPPVASQSVAGVYSQQAPTAPVYAELWGRLKWLSVGNSVDTCRAAVGRTSLLLVGQPVSHTRA